MTVTKEQQSLGLRDKLTEQLKTQNLWQEQTSSTDALASSVPFDIDILAFDVLASICIL